MVTNLCVVYDNDDDYDGDYNAVWGVTKLNPQVQFCFIMFFYLWSAATCVLFVPMLPDAGTPGYYRYVVKPHQHHHLGWFLFSFPSFNEEITFTADNVDG